MDENFNTNVKGTSLPGRFQRLDQRPDDGIRPWVSLWGRKLAEEELADADCCLTCSPNLFKRIPPAGERPLRRGDFALHSMWPISGFMLKEAECVNNNRYTGFYAQTTAVQTQVIIFGVRPTSDRYKTDNAGPGPCPCGSKWRQPSHAPGRVPPQNVRFYRTYPNG